MSQVTLLRPEAEDERNAYRTDVLSDAEALMKEARQRQRRRWLIIGAALLLVATGSGLALSGSDGGGNANLPPAGSGSASSTPFASPFAVRQFTALLHKGLHDSYVANYQYLGAHKAPFSFVYVHVGQTAANSSSSNDFPWPPFLYEARANGMTYEFFSGSGNHFFQCLTHGSRQPWSCSGPPLIAGFGFLAQVLSYDVATDYLMYFDPPVHRSTLTHREMGRFRYACLSYHAPQGQAGVQPDNPTWCITARGTLGFVTGVRLVRGIQLVSMSMGIPARELKPPARLGKWTGFAWSGSADEQYWPFAPPGWATG